MLPVSHKRILRLALRAVLRYRNAHGATFAASLANELADSALLGYLRHRLRGKRRRKSGQISLRQSKKPPHGWLLLWRRRRDLNTKTDACIYWGFRIF